MLPKRKQIHLANFDYANPNRVYFITICTHAKQPYFDNSKIVKAIETEISYRTETANEVTIFAYCIMSDHIHMLMKLKESYGKTLQNWITAFKRYTAREINELFGIRPLWQKNFYEHIVRNGESLEKIAQYVAENPVRKSLVGGWREYPYSKINFGNF